VLRNFKCSWLTPKCLPVFQATAFYTLLSLTTHSLTYPSVLPDQIVAGPAAAAVLAFARRLAAASPSGVASSVSSGEFEAQPAGGVAGPSLPATAEDRKDKMLQVMGSGGPTAAAEEELVIGGSAVERRAVHRLCDRLGLSHSSVGHGDGRRVVVRRGVPPVPSPSPQRRPQPCFAGSSNDISESGAKRQRGADISDAKVLLAPL
jgi:hypothetical protein